MTTQDIKAIKFYQS